MRGYTKRTLSIHTHSRKRKYRKLDLWISAKLVTSSGGLWVLWPGNLSALVLQVSVTPTCDVKSLIFPVFVLHWSSPIGRNSVQLEFTRPWVRFPAELRCVFSSDPAVSSSIFVGDERVENLIGNDPDKSEFTSVCIVCSLKTSRLAHCTFRLDRLTAPLPSTLHWTCHALLP